MAEHWIKPSMDSQRVGQFKGDKRNREGSKDNNRTQSYINFPRGPKIIFPLKK